MSATMSGDTPFRQLFSKKFRFLSSTLPGQTPCKYWAPRREEILMESGEKRGKKRAKKGNLRSSRALKTCYIWYPRNITDTSGGDHTMTQLLTVDDVQTALAVSRATVWRLIQSRELETIHIRRAIRIPADALETYIDNARLLEGSKR